MKPKRSIRQGGANRARAHVEQKSLVYYHTQQQQGIDNRVKQLLLERCAPQISGPSVLELGYVDGLWTDAMVSRGLSVDVVEGASRHVAHARQRYAGNSAVRVFHSLFQEFRPDRQYDTVLAGDMIRYVPDATVFLRRARSWLLPGGRLVATVPNSRSLHRRVGALMGLEPTPQALNAQDRAVGNLRTYDKYEFKHLLVDAGFDVVELRGCFLKPLSSSQMTDWSDELLRAFLLAGDELEDYCWFLYAVSRIAASAT